MMVLVTMVLSLALQLSMATSAAATGLRPGLQSLSCRSYMRDEKTYRAVGGVGSNDGGVGVNGAILVASAVSAVVDRGGSAGREIDEGELHVAD